MREIRRADQRFRTVGDGVMTRHSFSYGAHYDPDNIGFGPLIAINTETVEPGGGYDEHHHADVEIVTWVLEGALRHDDSTGHRGVIRPGHRPAAQRRHRRAAHRAERVGRRAAGLRADDAALDARRRARVRRRAHVDAERRLTPVIAVHAPAELFVVRLGAGRDRHRPGQPAEPRARHDGRDPAR